MFSLRRSATVATAKDKMQELRCKAQEPLFVRSDQLNWSRRVRTNARRQSANKGWPGHIFWGRPSGHARRAAKVATSDTFRVFVVSLLARLRPHNTPARHSHPDIGREISSVWPQSLTISFPDGPGPKTPKGLSPPRVKTHSENEGPAPPHVSCCR